MESIPLTLIEIDLGSPLLTLPVFKVRVHLGNRMT